MNSTNAIQPPLRERIKYALPPVLALVLCGVLYQNFQPSQPIPPPAARRSAAPGSNSAVETAGAGDPAAAWQTFRLDEIIAFDPFAPRDAGGSSLSIAESSATEAGGEPADPATAVDAPRQPKPFSSKVQAIYRLGKRTVALVDSRWVKAGDLFEGRRVLEVTPKGVLFADEN